MESCPIVSVPHYDQIGMQHSELEDVAYIARERNKGSDIVVDMNKLGGGALSPRIQKAVIGRNEGTVTSSVFNELRLEGHFCDVVICVDGAEFKAHKNILCGCSSYFRALFAGDWTARDKRTYHIPGVSAEMMLLIMDYAYTGSAAAAAAATVTERNARELLAAADQFAVTGLVAACCDFLAARLAPWNCVGVWRLTDTYFCPELRRAAFGYILRHFDLVVAAAAAAAAAAEVEAEEGEGEVSEGFLALTAAQLAEVIGADELNVRREEAVFEAVARWAAHMPEERADSVVTLLPKIRLALTSDAFLADHVWNHALVGGSEACRATVAEALKAARGLDTAWDFSNPLTRPRLPHAVLLAHGGWSGGAPTGAMETYDSRADRWVPVPQEGGPGPRAYHGAVSLGGFVYCVGGFDGVSHHNSTWRFDPASRSWRQVAPMHCRRCYVSVTALGGHLYAMGGFDGHLRVSTAERYQPETNQWTLIAPMQVQRSDAGATALRGQVYICGGFDGSDCLLSAESYSPETNQWTMMAAMGGRRSGVGVIAYREEVYVVGGFDGTNRLRTAEAYDPVGDAWRPVAPMAVPRSNFGAEVIDDMLFAAGGFSGLATETRVECYDRSADRWYRARDMGASRSALACCVLSGLPNISEYAAPRHPVDRGAPEGCSGKAHEDEEEDDEEEADDDEEEEEEEDDEEEADDEEAEEEEGDDEEEADDEDEEEASG